MQGTLPTMMLMKFMMLRELKFIARMPDGEGGLLCLGSVLRASLSPGVAGVALSSLAHRAAWSGGRPGASAAVARGRL